MGKLEGVSEDMSNSSLNKRVNAVNVNPNNKTIMSNIQALMPATSQVALPSLPIQSGKASVLPHHRPSPSTTTTTTNPNEPNSEFSKLLQQAVSNSNSNTNVTNSNNNVPSLNVNPMTTTTIMTAMTSTAMTIHTAPQTSSTQSSNPMLSSTLNAQNNDIKNKNENSVQNSNLLNLTQNETNNTQNTQNTSNNVKIEQWPYGSHWPYALVYHPQTTDAVTGQTDVSKALPRVRSAPNLGEAMPKRRDRNLNRRIHHAHPLPYPRNLFPQLQVEDFAQLDSITSNSSSSNNNNPNITSNPIPAPNLNSTATSSGTTVMMIDTASSLTTTNSIINSSTDQVKQETVKTEIETKEEVEEKVEVEEEEEEEEEDEDEEEEVEEQKKEETEREEVGKDVEELENESVRTVNKVPESLRLDDKVLAKLEKIERNFQKQQEQENINLATQIQNNNKNLINTKENILKDTNMNTAIMTNNNQPIIQQNDIVIGEPPSSSLQEPYINNIGFAYHEIRNNVNKDLKNNNITPINLIAHRDNRYYEYRLPTAAAAAAGTGGIAYTAKKHEFQQPESNGLIFPVNSQGSSRQLIRGANFIRSVSSNHQDTASNVVDRPMQALMDVNANGELLPSYAPIMPFYHLTHQIPQFQHPSAIFSAIQHQSTISHAAAVRPGQRAQISDHKSLQMTGPGQSLPEFFPAPNASYYYRTTPATVNRNAMSNGAVANAGTTNSNVTYEAVAHHPNQQGSGMSHFQQPSQSQQQLPPPPPPLSHNMTTMHHLTPSWPTNATIIYPSNPMQNFISKQNSVLSGSDMTRDSDDVLSGDIESLTQHLEVARNFIDRTRDNKNNLNSTVSNNKTVPVQQPQKAATSTVVANPVTTAIQQQRKRQLHPENANPYNYRLNVGFDQKRDNRTRTTEYMQTAYHMNNAQPNQSQQHMNIIYQQQQAHDLDNVTSSQQLNSINNKSSAVDVLSSSSGNNNSSTTSSNTTNTNLSVNNNALFLQQQIQSSAIGTNIIEANPSLNEGNPCNIGSEVLSSVKASSRGQNLGNEKKALPPKQPVHLSTDDGKRLEIDASVLQAVEAALAGTTEVHGSVSGGDSSSSVTSLGNGSSNTGGQQQKNGEEVKDNITTNTSGRSHQGALSNSSTTNIENMTPQSPINRNGINENSSIKNKQRNRNQEIPGGNITTTTTTGNRRLATAASAAAGK